jgi:hypothetical protein
MDQIYPLSVCLGGLVVAEDEHRRQSQPQFCGMVL